MERQNGAFKWSESHNSRFKLSKFTLLDFHYNTSTERRPLKLCNTTIASSWTQKFLGIVIDQTLCWNVQAAHALSKGTAYIMQISCISSANKGLPATLLKHLYLAVAIPKMLYAIDVWCTPPYSFDKTKKTRGSLSVIMRINHVQRQALTTITGVFCTTATDVLEIYTNTLPIEHHIQNLCHQAAIRIASHPPSHPLHSCTQKAAARMVK
ncbi:hypothetical protein PISMIDRAFT_17420 [Pisolithus microcarpus 441]|uniref:Uncharacterized protein n=1 Tax=Pisolithus microcarpus 441 TaxID=765257 RepID=A0A0C9XPD4_9AGAM|nr:hypothetical protein PISMIDRAFT_17420 [Pisolithus microcarpus 441]